jgi:hypothetical protein
METKRSLTDDKRAEKDPTGSLADLERQLKREQIGKRRVEKELLRLRLRVERGEYVPMAEVKGRDLARIHVVRRGLLELGRTLAPRLVGMTSEKDLEVTIKLEARRLLERFAAL